jgi:hypothetical protein
MSDRPKLGLVEPEELDEEEKEPDQGDRTAAGRRSMGASVHRPGEQSLQVFSAPADRFPIRSGLS